MKIKNYTIWILMVIAVLVIGGMLFKNSLMHQEILDKQAVKNTELLKFSFIHQYEEFCDEFEDRLRVQEKKSESNTLGNFKEFFDFFKKEISKDPIVFSSEKNTKNLTEHKLEFYNGEILIHFHPDKNVKDKLHKVEIPFEKLFINYKPYGFFDRIFLTDKNGTVKWSNSEYFGSKLIDFKKIVKNEKHTFSVTKGEIVLNNEPYFIYFTQVEIDGLKFNLAGLISEANFKIVGFRLDHSLTTYLIFLLVLVLASVPILSVLSLKKGDVLTRSKVYACGLSLLAILLFLGGFTSMNLREFHPEKVKLIQTQTDKIGIDSAKKKYEKRIFEIKCKLSLNEPFKNYERDGLSKQIVSINSQGGWLNEVKLDNSDQHIIPVPLGTIALSKRSYVNYFRDLTKDTTRYYIGSHYSRLNGNLESVVSRKIDNEIIAITFNLADANKDSLLYSIDNTNSILVIKNDGKVVHKSENVKSPIDSIQQFLSKEKWLQLKYLMENNFGQAELNDIWEIPLHLDGLDYRAFVSLIGGSKFDQPLWFIFFQSNNSEEIKSSLVSVETTVYFFLYILSLLFISLLTKVFKPVKPKYNWSAFSYGFLKPDGINKLNYILLVIIFILTAFTIVIFMSNLNFVRSFYIIIMTLFFVSIMIRFLISPNKSRSMPPHLNKFITPKFVGIVLIISIIITYIYSNNINITTNEKYLLGGYLVLILLVGSPIFKRLNQIKLIGYLEKKISLNYSFSLFLFSWFTLVGFIPGLFIAEKISNYEDHIWDNANKKDIPNTTEKIDWLDGFEEKRRYFFSSISTPFYEPEIKSFISPNNALLQNAIVNSKNSLKIDFLSLTVILIVLGLIYRLIYYLTYKLFWLDTSLKFLENNFIKDRKKKSETDSNELKVFLCGITTEICRNYVKENIINDNEVLVVIDCNLLPTMEFKFNSTFLSMKKEIWMIENIHCLFDQTILIKKLPRLIEKARKCKVSLVLSSGISWKELIKTLPDAKTQITYSEIFSSFYFDYVPLKLVSNIFEINGTENNEENEYLYISENIFDENSMIKFLNKNLIGNELEMNFNLFLQRYGKAYYFNIWSELSFDERKICYFFSKEGLINYANYEMVVELIQKGIFHIDEKTKKIRLFSDGFRSFALSQASDDLLEEFNKDEKRNGIGMTVEIAVVSFIFIMLALISFFDKNFLNQTTTIVTGTAGVLGSLYSLVGRLFPSLNTKQ